jgi:hypothetical protein
MIPSMTKLDAFGSSCTSLFIFQVTTGCDPSFILKDAFDVHEWEGADRFSSQSR